MTQGPLGPPNPYGGYPPYAAGPPRTDGVSLAALVCSLSCCAAPVAIGLGIAGLVRTKGGRRGGRWAAVTGLVLGIVLTLGIVAFGVLVTVTFQRTIWEDQARVGQCLDLDFLDEPAKADCDDPHDGEIVAVGAFDTDLLDAYDDLSTADFCAQLDGIDPAYVTALGEARYDAGISMDSLEDDDPGDGDLFFCYVLDADGEKLTGTLRGTDTDAA